MKRHDERYQRLQGVPGHTSPREIRSAPHGVVLSPPNGRKRVRIGARVVCCVCDDLGGVPRAVRQAIGSFYARMTRG
ncbi:hypothetical protein D5R55_25080 [Burkholderia cenocepacia]|uniref:Uncharacterized protein n=1 Tax=Burkholderia cenocepacia TaxID=95486 RepID=A0A3S9NF26_9BURK|nr:hypothetical protein D5R55_25080 [Burkholderia cenocepacia]